MPKERSLNGFTLDRAAYQRYIKVVGVFSGRFLASTALVLAASGSRVSAAEDPNAADPDNALVCDSSNLAYGSQQPPPECFILADQGTDIVSDGDTFSDVPVTAASDSSSEPPQVAIVAPTFTPTLQPVSPTPQPANSSTLVAKFDHASSLTEAQRKRIQDAQSQVLDYYKNVAGQAVEGQVTNNYINDGPSPHINPAEGSNTLYTTNIWLKNGNPSGAGIDLESDFTLKQLLAHEYDLWIQSMFYIKGGYPKGMLPPVWRNEGESELWAYRAADYLLPGHGYLDQALRCDIHSFQANQALKRLDLSTLLSNADFSNQPGVYGLSLLGYDFLITSKTPLINYKQEMAISADYFSKSGPLGADVSFAQAHKIGLNDFYSDFSRWLSSQSPTNC